MPSQREKCERFAQLHQQQDGFIIPNPWDMGSARLLQCNNNVSSTHSGHYEEILDLRMEDTGFTIVLS